MTTKIAPPFVPFRKKASEKKKKKKKRVDSRGPGGRGTGLLMIMIDKKETMQQKF